MTRERRLWKYWERMVTVGRKAKQCPRPVNNRREHIDSHWPVGRQNTAGRRAAHLCMVKCLYSGAKVIVKA
uniref:Uncharacterized protein n=1 Tax=Anguilla anguilla TaxID=7936 RepID=A0A0E9QRP2_ANGAN